MISNFTVTQEISLRSAPTAGITSLDIHREQDQFIIAGDINGSVSLYDRKTSNVFQKY